MSKQPTTPPAGWEVKRLKDVADIRFSSVDKKSRPGEKPVRLCNYVDAYKNEYLTGRESFMEATATDAEIAQFGIQTGDIMVTKDSETPDDIGVPSVYVGESGRLVCGYHLALVRPDQDEVNPVFLAKQIRHNRLARYFGRVCNGLTRYGLPTSAFEDAEIWQPERPEQDAIARVLQSMDDAIRAAGALIEKLKRIKAGLLLDLLTRGIDEDGKLRDPRRHPEQFRQTPTGRTPREWEVCLLDAVAVRGSGHTPNKNVPSYWNGGIKWVSLADSDKLDQIYISETDKNISELGIENSSAVLHPAGTVILSRDAGVGKSSILAEPMAVSQHFMAWRCSERLENLFLYYWLQHNKPRFEAIASGSTIKTIGLRYFKLLEIEVPPFLEQRAITRAMLAAEDTLASERRRLEKLEMVRGGLMEDLLGGEVRVPAAMVGAPAYGAAEGKIVRLGPNIHFKRAVLAAELVDQMHGDITFGHVKLMKTLYLVERLAELELGSHYLRAAAGPFDNRLLRSVDAQLKKKEWFDKVPRTGNGAAGGKPLGWCYVPLAKRGGHRQWFEKYWGRAKAKIQAVIDRLRPLDTQRCEILATLYEAWRALASGGKAVSDAAVVDEVLERWHERKQAIPRERWLNALEWMREEGMIPKAGASKT